MSVWLLVPFALGQVIIFAAITRPGILPKETPSIIPLNVPQTRPTSVRPLYPWFEGPPYTLFWGLSGSTIATAGGSTSPIDLVNFQAKTEAESFRISFPSNSSCKIAPVGFGYVFFTGNTNVRITYSLQLPNVGPQTFIKQLSANYISVPIEYLYGTITLEMIGSNTSRATLVSQAQMWGDEFSVPTYGLYLMQPFLEFHNAFTLRFTDLNYTFDIIESGNTYVVTIPRGPELMNPTTFLSTVQTAIDQALIGSGLTLGITLQSFDTENPGLLHVANLVWTPSVAMSISLTGLSDPNQLAATAATFGLYVFDPTSSSNASPISNYLLLPATTNSPSPIIIQWPSSWLIRAFANPGSHDTDGYLRIYSPSGSPTPDLIFGASSLRYRLHAPTAYFGPFDSTLSLASGPTIRSLITVVSTATSTTTQDLQVSEWTIFNDAAWQAFCTTYAATNVTLQLTSPSNTAAVAGPALLNTLWSNIGNPGATVCNLLAVTGSVALTGQSITDSFLFVLSILDGATVLATVNVQVEFKSFGTSVTRYYTGQPGIPNIFSAAPTTATMEGWAGGGASITRQGTTYGGASARVNSEMNLNGTVHTLEVFVGSKGTQITPYKATGGLSTYVLLNGSKVFHIGGGGGAGNGSHGGIGGAPLDAIVPAGPNVYFGGYSGSTEPFSSDDALLTQVVGPTAKPVSSSTGLTETAQGSGAGPSGAKGQSGYNVVGSKNQYETDGGQPGQGYGGLGSLVAFGGPGCVATAKGQYSTLYGGGGGGATFAANVGTSEGPFTITALEMTPAWTPFVGTTTLGPAGGGLPPKSTGPPSQWFTAVETFCNNISLLGLGLSFVWGRDQENAWCTKFITLLAAKVGLNGRLASPETSQYLLWPYDEAFVNINPATDSTTVTSYVPVGPHDSSFPGSGGPNVRAIETSTGELAILDDGFTLCVYNDGQIEPQNVAFFLNTSLTGQTVPVGTLVTSIRMAPSQPTGLFQAIYLGLSEPVVDVGPGFFTWNLTLSENALGQTIGLSPYPGTKQPEVFSNGTTIRADRLLTPKASPWDVTYNLSEIDPKGTPSFLAMLYDAMVHTYLQSSDTALPGFETNWYPNEFTLPVVGLNEPSYVTKIWPAYYSDVPSSDLMRVRVFLRPSTSAPSVPNANKKTIQSFSYSGLPETYSIGPNVKQVTVHAFGAGATSSSEETIGASGTYVFGTFTNLAGRTVTVYVGQGGGSTAISSEMRGGLNASGTRTLGGGLTGLKLGSETSEEWLAVAAGGGSGGLRSSGVAEPCPDRQSLRAPLDGRVGSIGSSRFGANAVSDASGAGGSGITGGSSGASLFSGASGSSLVPVNGRASGIPQNQRLFNGNIGLGTSNLEQAGHGLLVLEFLY